MSVHTSEHINATKKRTREGSASTSGFTERSTFTQYPYEDGERYEEDVLHNFGQYGGYDRKCPSDDEGQSYGYNGSMAPSDDEEGYASSNASSDDEDEERVPERQTISEMRKKRKVEE